MKNIMVVTSASCGAGVLAGVERVHAKLAPVAEDSRNLEVHQYKHGLSRIDRSLTPTP